MIIDAQEEGDSKMGSREMTTLELAAQCDLIEDM